MHVERQGGVRADGLYDGGADGQVRHEMPVHHVDMHKVRAGFGDGGNFLAEPCKIGGEDRRGNADGMAHALRISSARGVSQQKYYFLRKAAAKNPSMPPCGAR